MTYFQRKRIQQIQRQIEKRSAMKMDMDEMLERFLLSKWTAAFSISILVASVVFAIMGLWGIFAS